MIKEQETYLEQPEYSNFVNALIDQCKDDPDNQHFFSTLLNLELVDIHGNPTKLAKQVGLPDHNQDLIDEVTTVAMCKHAKESREDWLISARRIIAKVAAVDPNGLSTEELRKTIRNTVADIAHWHADLVKAMNNALDIVEYSGK